MSAYPWSTKHNRGNKFSIWNNPYKCRVGAPQYPSAQSRPNPPWVSEGRPFSSSRYQNQRGHHSKRRQMSVPVNKQFPLSPPPRPEYHKFRASNNKSISTTRTSRSSPPEAARPGTNNKIYRSPNPKLSALDRVRIRAPELCVRHNEHELQYNYNMFTAKYHKFIAASNPSILLPALVSNALICAQSDHFARSLADFIFDKITNQSGTEKDASCLKMRGLWLVGELMRDDYNVYKLRNKLGVAELFENFFAKCYVKIQDHSEIQAIYKFFETYAPRYIVHRLDSICCSKESLHHVMGGDKVYTCEEFYQKTVERSLSQSTTLGGPAHSYPARDDSKEPVASLSNVKVKQSLQVRADLGNIDGNKIEASISAQLDNLIAVPFGPGSLVPLAVRRLLNSFLLYGNMDQVSRIMSQKLLSRLFDKRSDPNKRVRILWVVGSLYFPDHAEQVKCARAILDRNRIEMFRILLTKITKEAHAEIREIFKFWKSVMSANVISDIHKFILESNNNPKPEYMFLMCSSEKGNKLGVAEFYKDNTSTEEDEILCVQSSRCQVQEVRQVNYFNLENEDLRFDTSSDTD